MNMNQPRSGLDTIWEANARFLREHSRQRVDLEPDATTGDKWVMIGIAVLAGLLIVIL